jgi:anti-sigma factor RsiW
MLHLDEGTVHAWLDGELPPDAAESAARHVATCAECQTLVAEARGLMAGASRIVSALDAGPAGVIPPAQRGPSSRRRPWSRFMLTPMRMSIAATIIVAVGVTITARRVAENSAVRGRMIDSRINTATKSAAAPSTDSVSASVVGLPTGKLEAPARTPPPIASANAGMSSPKPAASPAPQLTEAAALAQKAVSADKRAVTNLPRQAAAAPALSEPAPPAARLDSVRAKDEMAKVAVDSMSTAQTVERRFAAAGAGQLRGIATNQRDAEPTSVVVLRECYRLAVDSTDWRGVLPAGFALDLASSTLRTAGRVAGAGAGGGAGPAAAPKVAQPANTLLQFSSRTTLNPVHPMAQDGRLDSRVIGFWFAVRADTIGVRFASADPGKAVTVLLTGGGSNARVLSADRTDSVRVARAPCLP